MPHRLIRNCVPCARLRDRRRPLRRPVIRFGLLALASLVFAARANATWSIVMADMRTKEVAVGTVTCLTSFNLLRLVPVLLVGKGAAAVQSAGDFDGLRRPILFNGLFNQTPPADILAQVALVAGHQARQYGIVDTLGRGVTFSGGLNGEFKGGRTFLFGDMVVAFQGNVLVGACLLDAIEEVLLAPNLDFPEKLMLAMEAARNTGGDGRCSCAPATPTACGCPVRAGFTKAGHIGGMIVARIGDIDDLICDVRGCTSGDYFMKLNVVFQPASNPDPVFQLRSKFNAWRSQHVGRPDALHSTALLGTDPLPADGVSTTTMTITLRDQQSLPITTAIVGVTVQHAPGSAGVSTIGPVVDLGGGSFSVLIGGGGVAGLGGGSSVGAAVAGTDRFRITVDDGKRAVVLMPDPTLERCVPGPGCIPPPICGDQVVNQPSEQCDGTDDAACPGACLADCTCPPVATCGDNVVNQPSETCDGTDDAACPGVCLANCTCPPVAICGDNVVNQPGETCDGTDDAACPGVCLANCTCPSVATCGDNVVNQPGETCDGTDDAACPGVCLANCTCPSVATCGDNVVNQPGETCDGSDDAACPGLCQPDCTCASPAAPVPTASAWGLIAMATLLLVGARVLFSHRRRTDPAVRR